MGYCMETGKHKCSHLLDAFWTFEIGPITWLCQRVKKIQIVAVHPRCPKHQCQAFARP